MINYKSKKDAITDILSYLNRTYSQRTVYLGKTKIPDIELYHGVLLSYWECGVIAVVGRTMYLISMDDLYWFDDGVRSLSASYSDDLAKAFKRIDKYLREKGKPYFYKDTEIVCGYEL